MEKKKMELWKRGYESGAGFPVGIKGQSPCQAAELCGMRCLTQITPEGGICALNKWGHEIVIIEVAEQGVIAVDITFEKHIQDIGEHHRPRYQPISSISKKCRPSSDSRGGTSPGAKRDDKPPDKETIS
jgi:hypothetical protein